MNRNRLVIAARHIAAHRGESPATKLVALRKLFIQERRDWSKPGAPQAGWKRGELAEVVQALVHRDGVAEEWGDVGYYVAQVGSMAWTIYAAVTPNSIIESAVAKFEHRASP